MTERFYRLANDTDAQFCIRHWLVAASAVYGIMIRNIIDRRDRSYRWKTVNAIIEAVEHDNSCADADQAPEASPQ